MNNQNKRNISIENQLAAAKVFNYIWENGRVVKDVWYIDPQKIADELGMTKEMVNKIITLLVDEEIVGKDNYVKAEPEGDKFFAYLCPCAFSRFEKEGELTHLEHNSNRKS